ncbi:unnamed protein product, partial [Pleuronectes platessa]
YVRWDACRRKTTAPPDTDLLWTPEVMSFDLKGEVSKPTGSQSVVGEQQQQQEAEPGTAQIRNHVGNTALSN